MSFFSLRRIWRWSVTFPSFYSTKLYTTLSARHVFATLIDFAAKFGTENASDIPRLHLTLVEIHPATLARTLLIFELIERISLAENPVKELELETTLFYLYVSLAMPRYCEDMWVSLSRICFSRLTHMIEVS